VTQILRAESLTEMPVVGRLLATTTPRRPDLETPGPAAD
jgi:hypothetical protein